MFKLAEKADLCQISLTGMRSLVLLWLLNQEPRSLDEIREEFIKLGIMENSHSNDILRIDLNTLRAMGCEISRASRKTGYKYVLKKHPFSLSIESAEVELMKKVYKRIRVNNSVKVLRKYDDLFVKMANYISDEQVKQEMYGICALKDYDQKFIDELLEDCENNLTLKLVYRNPATKETTEKDIHAQKLIFQNDKVYLLGFDKDKQESVMLNAKRIISILSKTAEKGGVDTNKTHVRFHLKSFGINEIEENEKIVETNENGYIVEADYYNEFTAIQRVLSFGSDCTVLSPDEIREKVIQKLKEMRNNYNA